MHTNLVKCDIYFLYIQFLGPVCDLIENIYLKYLMKSEVNTINMSNDYIREEQNTDTDITQPHTHNRN